MESRPDWITIWLPPKRHRDHELATAPKGYFELPFHLRAAPGRPLDSPLMSITTRGEFCADDMMSTLLALPNLFICSTGYSCAAEQPPPMPQSFNTM